MCLGAAFAAFSLFLSGMSVPMGRNVLSFRVLVQECKVRLRFRGFGGAGPQTQDLRVYKTYSPAPQCKYADIKILSPVLLIYRYSYSTLDVYMYMYM